MAYTPQTWNDNDAATPVNAARMGHIETGIDDAHDLIADHETRIDDIETTGYSLATVPAGSCIVVTGAANTARPTARTDVVVRWRCPSTPDNAIDGDEFVVTS